MAVSTEENYKLRNTLMLVRITNWAKHETAYGHNTVIERASRYINSQELPRNSICTIKIQQLLSIETRCFIQQNRATNDHSHLFQNVDLVPQTNPSCMGHYNLQDQTYEQGWPELFRSGRCGYSAGAQVSVIHH
jgi:hypothetical protein